MDGICPIQIIDDKNSLSNRWITLKRDIHRIGIGGNYDNIVGYHKGGTFGIELIRQLVTGRNKSSIYTSDVIRNPTLEELKDIDGILRKSGYKLNLKTYQLIKI
jgi:hypothetical protein